MKLRDLIALSRKVVSERVVELRSDYVARFSPSGFDEISEQSLLPVRRAMGDEPLRLVSVQKVADVVRRAISKEVRFVPVAVDGPSVSVYGYVDNRSDCSFIVYNDKLNLCWTRFTIVKELMHLYSRTARGFSLDVEGNVLAAPLVECAMRSRWVEEIRDLSSVELDDETIALLMAIEVLCPWPLRRQLSFMRESGASFYQMAKAFLIPRNIVKYLFETTSDGFSYFTLSNRIHEEIGK